MMMFKKCIFNRTVSVETVKTCNQITRMYQGVKNSDSYFVLYKSKMTTVLM